MDQEAWVDEPLLQQWAELACGVASCQRKTGGMMKHTLLLTLNDRSEYVLCVYDQTRNANFTPHRVNAIHALTHFLHAGGLPVVQPLLTSGGTVCAPYLQGSTAVLHPHYAGLTGRFYVNKGGGKDGVQSAEPYEPWQIECIGGFLGRLHTLPTGSLREHLKNAGIEANAFRTELSGECVRAAVKGTLSVVAKGSATDVGAPRWSEVCRTVLRNLLEEPKWTALLQDLEDSLHTDSTADVVVHGDLHDENVLMLEGELVVTLDWDDACIGKPQADVILGMAFWCLGPDYRLQKDRCASFIRAYGCARGAACTKQEVASLRCFGVASMLLQVRDMVNTGPDFYPQLEAYCKETLTPLEQLTSMSSQQFADWIFPSE